MGMPLNSPVRKRVRIAAPMEWHDPNATAKAAFVASPRKSTGLRPKRSAARPKGYAPMTRPTMNAAVMTPLQ